MTSLITEPIPIRADEHGRLRVGKTRVLLDLVIYAFRLGHAPEIIVDQFPTLALDEVYLIIGYYLRHRDALDAYLLEQEAEAQAFRQEHEAQHPPRLTREILLARLEAKRRAASGG